MKENEETEKQAKSMKQIFFYITMLFTTIVLCTNLASCSKDDEADTPITENVSSPTGTTNGHGYVDLGLSVSWATCNMGADNPQDYGELYPFAYFGNSNATNMPRNICGTKWDRATCLWGSDWRMPTIQELYELYNCEWTETSYKGIKGATVTGPNGNSIFLPYAGHGYIDFEDDDYIPINPPYPGEQYGKGEYVVLWSGMCITSKDELISLMWPYWMSSIYLDDMYIRLQFPRRTDDLKEPSFDYGGGPNFTYSIRPVTTKGASGTSGGNGGGDGTGNNGSSSYEKPDIGFYDFTAYQTKLKVVYKIYNKDKAKVTSAKIYYGTSSASKSVSATVSGTQITATISGLKAGTSYYVKCSATGKGGTTTTETTKLITNY